MTDLDAMLKCTEHDAPELVCKITTKKGKGKFVCEFTVVCPVDQKLEKKPLELLSTELKNLNLALANKIFRCEKCFREAEIQETVIEKKGGVSIYLSCPQDGRLIIREISPELYDGIRNAWDIKDVKKEEAKTY